MGNFFKKTFCIHTLRWSIRRFCRRYAFDKLPEVDWSWATCWETNERKKKSWKKVWPCQVCLNHSDVCINHIMELWLEFCLYWFYIFALWPLKIFECISNLHASSLVEENFMFIVSFFCIETLVCHSSISPWDVMFAMKFIYKLNCIAWRVWSKWNLKQSFQKVQLLY